MRQLNVNEYGIVQKSFKVMDESVDEDVNEGRWGIV